MNAVAVFLFVIGLVGFAPGQVIGPQTIAGPYTFQLEFNGYSTVAGGNTAGGDSILEIGSYNYKTSTNPQSTLTYDSTFENPLSGTLRQVFIYGWNGVLTDVYITHILLVSPNTTPTYVNMRGKTSFSGVDGAGQNFIITSEYPKTTIVNNVLTGTAATRNIVNIAPSATYSKASYETRSIP